MACMLALDDGLVLHVCLFTDPKDWNHFRVAYSQVGQLLGVVRLRWLFERQLSSLLLVAGGDHSAHLSVHLDVAQRVGMFRDAAVELGRAVESLHRVARLAVSFPWLVSAGLSPVRTAVNDLHEMLFQGKPLQAKERGSRSSSAEPGRTQRKMVRRLAEETGMLECWSAMLSAFLPEAAVRGPHSCSSPVMPTALFAQLCDLISVVLHSSERVKATFLASDGHVALLRLLRSAAEDAVVQVAGLTVLVSASACSERSVEVLVSEGCHELAIEASRRFPHNFFVVSGVVSLLANMSNVPDVCPLLRLSGGGELAETLCTQPLGDGRVDDDYPCPDHGAHGGTITVYEPSEDQIHFIKDFASYLKDNLA